MLRRTRLVWKVGVFPLQLDPPTVMHHRLFHDVIQRRGLEKLVIVPHTKFAVTIHHSLHLAALAGLAVRDDPLLDVDFGALERPDVKLPRIGQLLEKYGPDTELIHWFHDRHSIASYEACDSYLDVNHLTLLRIPGVGDEDDAPHSAFQDQLTRTLQSRTSVLDVEHRRGSETRRMLFEGEADPNSIVAPAVLKYINSHHLYRDFRKLNRYSRGAYQTHRATTRGHTYDFAAQVALEGSIPRLQVLHDEHNPAARELAERLKDFAVAEGEEPDLIVPIGGDGFMMQSIRRHWQRFIPFFGVNAGHVGYLLNDAAHLEELMTSPLKLYHTAMLYAVAQPESPAIATEAGFQGPQEALQEAPPPEIEQLAFNDAWIERSTGQTALINVSVNGMRRLTRARGDGVLVSTAAGSTAYAIALGASPVPIGATMLPQPGRRRRARAAGYSQATLPSVRRRRGRGPRQAVDGPQFPRRGRATRVQS